MHFNEVVLEKIRFQCVQTFSPEMLADLSVRESIHTSFARAMTTAILALPLWAEDMGEHETEVRYDEPVDWWQHFKAAKFPRWALRLWPVQERTTCRMATFQAYAVYPKFAMIHPEQECRIQYRANTQVDGV